jgi:hypothetical protein
MRFPFGNGRHAPIAAEDQGRVIAAILKDPGPHAGKTYPLFGPVEMDHHELATRISEPLGRQVTYLPQEIAEFRAQFANNPNAPAHLVQHLCEVAQDYQDGLFKGQTTTSSGLRARSRWVSKTSSAFTYPNLQPDHVFRVHHFRFGVEHSLPRERLIDSRRVANAQRLFIFECNLRRPVILL